MAVNSAGVGFVTASFAQGAVLVQDSAGRVTRLSWEDPEQKEKRRELTPGKYAMRGYRLMRKDDRGTEWFVSATGPEIKTFEVTAGKETRIQVDETILLRSGLRLSGRQANVSMAFQGENNSGLTVYAASKRIPVTFRLLNAHGTEIAHGSMKYG